MESKLIKLVVLLAVAALSVSGFAPHPPVVFLRKRSAAAAAPTRRSPRSTTTSAVQPLRMGLKVTIRIVGRKTSEQWLQDACAMYLQRLKPVLEVETVWHKNDAALVKGVSTDYDNSSSTVVLLDPAGKTYTSEKLADNIYRWLGDGGSRLTFVIGGADGLPSELKYGDGGSGQQRQPILFSLSKLTFTHQFARLVLIEQIYRASEIRKGSRYHK